MGSGPLTGLGLLLVEDEALLRRRYQHRLEEAGAEVSAAGSLEEARRLAGAVPVEAALVDVNLPDGRGLRLLTEGVLGAGVVTIVMTAEGGVEGAVEAMRVGAADYLVKPFDLDELPLRFARARRARNRRRAEEHAGERAEAEEGLVFGPSLEPLRRQLEQIVAADRRLVSGVAPPVLVEGETGTGKTSVARWLHRQGPRSAGPLVEVNCAALPEALAESELFGHERGAFTDAKEARVGLFEAAEGGTLFLDELPSLPVALQAKLLTVLEDRAVRRVGGTKPRPVDARVIAATNVDLARAVAEGRFRADLLHRLDLFRVRLPPLRERPAEIVPLAEALLVRVARRYGLKPAAIPAAACRRLEAYRWPGNVRELAHELEREVVFGDGTLAFLRLGGGAVPVGGEHGPDWLVPGYRFPESGFNLEEAIGRLVRLAVEQTGGNVSAAARLLGVTRDVVRGRLETRVSTGYPPDP